MQEVAAALAITPAHNFAGNGSSRLRPRHLERPKSFHVSATTENMLPAHVEMRKALGGLTVAANYSASESRNDVRLRYHRNMRLKCCFLLTMSHERQENHSRSYTIIAQTLSIYCKYLI